MSVVKYRGQPLFTAEVVGYDRPWWGWATVRVPYAEDGRVRELLVDLCSRFGTQFSDMGSGVFGLPPMYKVEDAPVEDAPVEDTPVEDAPVEDVTTPVGSPNLAIKAHDYADDIAQALIDSIKDNLKGLHSEDWKVIRDTLAEAARRGYTCGFGVSTRATTTPRVGW